MNSEVINEKVSVVLVCSREKAMIMPYKMRWQGREYKMTQLAYHHKARLGRTIMHIFHVTDGTNDYRLRLDTETLGWTLEEVLYGT